MRWFDQNLFVLSAITILNVKLHWEFGSQFLVDNFLAEDEGFEPSVGCPTHAFQACALGRYANPPLKLPINISCG